MPTKLNPGIVPSSRQRMVTADGTSTAEFQRFFNAIAGPPSAVQSISLSPSPMSFVSSANGTLAVVGGSVSAITLTRGGSTVNLGTSTRLIPVSNADVVAITYTGTPTMTFIPA